MIENKHWLSQIELGKWYSNAQYYYRPRNDKERNLMHYCYEEGYNNGFSRGYPKWHDLRRDPNDLPKERKRVLLCIEVVRKKFENFKVYIEGIYDKGECLGEYDSCWLYQEADKKVLTEIVDSQRVIAWCEIPQFKE